MDPDTLPPALAERVAELQGLCAALGRARAATPREVLQADRALRASPSLPRVLELLAEVDALQAMAEVTAEQEWTFPRIVDGDALVLDVQGLRHPALASPVPNSLAFSEAANLLFLTGPNMAGKTTLLRSLGVAVVLAQAGMGVPAESMTLSPRGVLFTSLNPRDDLREGLSYFLAEVRRVRTAAEALARGRRGLFLFDEVFKGTNVRDALEASLLVIRGFAHRRESASIFASHLAELVPELERVPGIFFRCFEGEVTPGGEARYSYEIQAGSSDQRFGLLLLRQEGVPELLAVPEGEGGPPTTAEIR